MFSTVASGSFSVWFVVLVIVIVVGYFVIASKRKM